MTTTITATPQPTTASVLLEVNSTAAPIPVADWDAADLYTDAPNWFTYVSRHTSGGLTRIQGTDGTASRGFSGLTIGERYRFTVYAQRGATAETCTLYDGDSVVMPFTIPAGSGVWAHPVELDAAATTMYLTVSSDVWMERVTVDELPSDYSFTLTRSDANGIRPVRLYAGQDLESGALIVTDYEAALSGAITYTVTTTETDTATTALNLDETWLMVPVTPQYSTRLSLVEGYEESLEARSTVHKIIDSPDVAVSLRPMGKRSGTLTIWCADYTDAKAIRSLYARGAIVMLRQATYPGLDMYHTCTGRLSVRPKPDNTPQRRWEVTVDYTETQRPTDALSGALGWDIAASMERNPTYASSAAEWPTYADLLVGPTA